MASPCRRAVQRLSGMRPVTSRLTMPMAACSRVAVREFSCLKRSPVHPAQQAWMNAATLQAVRRASQNSSGGGFPMWSIPVFLVVGGGSLFLIRTKKHEVQEEQDKQQRMSVGKALIGGPFELVDLKGRTVTEKDFEGDFVLIYFGFTNCPDVCPDQLDKLTAAIKKMDAIKKYPPIQPVLISVDPERDTPEAMVKYLSEFHPRFIGLTGTKEQIDKVCKEYRVYYSMSPKDDDNDYIVDHTIICYLVAPDGEFLDYFGQNRTAEDIAAGMAANFTKYMLEHGDLGGSLRAARLAREKEAQSS